VAWHVHFWPSLKGFKVHEFRSKSRASAEGKNKDILAAAQAAVSADLSSAAITLTYPNPLTDLCENSNAIRTFSYQMNWIKDGYLATNSLLATVLLAYRAFFGDIVFQKLENAFSEQCLSERRSLFSLVFRRINDSAERIAGTAF
jgi:fructoselysine-6-P-deglycase FrlB-like protein